MTVIEKLRSQSIGIAALVVALGGTSYAATSLPRNSVTTVQLAPNAVTSADVKNRTIKATDLAPGVAVSGPRGATGATGDTGAPGAPGAPGSAAAYTLVKPGPSLTLGPTKNITSVVNGAATGVFCLDVAVPINNVQLTWAYPQIDISADYRLVALADPNSTAYVDYCDPAHGDLLVFARQYTHNGSTTSVYAPFYVSIN